MQFILQISLFSSNFKRLKATADENGEEGNEIDSPASTFEVKWKSKGNGHKKRCDGEELAKFLEHSDCYHKLGIDEYAKEERSKAE